MTDRQLISKEDFYEYETICNHTDPANIVPYIREAQMFDLVTVINKELIEDIQENFGTALNTTLLALIKPVLCYYTYARYVMDGGVADTPYGMVTKTNEFSQPASEKAISRKSTNAKSMAYAYADTLIKYLSENKSSYPLWEQTQCAQSESRKSSVRITEVSNK